MILWRLPITQTHFSGSALFKQPKRSKGQEIAWRSAKVGSVSPNLRIWPWNLAHYFCWIGRKEREEASTGDSRHPEESRDRSWSSSHSTMPYEATLHPQIQHPDDQSQSFSKGIQRYAWSHMAVTTTTPNFICTLYVVGVYYLLLRKAWWKLHCRSKAIEKVSFTPSSRSDSFGAGLHPRTSVPDQLGLNMPASDISLLDASSDRHSISQGSESGYQTTSQHNSPFNPYNISAPYSAKNLDHQQDQTQNQYYPGTVHYSGQYIPSSSSLLLPDQIPPHVPGDVTYQHQSQGPLHGQRISYHVRPSE